MPALKNFGQVRSVKRVPAQERSALSGLAFIATDPKFLIAGDFLLHFFIKKVERA